MTDHDVVVIGAGPAGLSAAIAAALAGRRVTVIDRQDGVIDKACGEGLMPATLDALHALGVDPPGLPFTGIRYLADGVEAHGRFRVPGRGVRRLALHTALAARAAELGVVRRAGAVRDVGVHENHVTLDGESAAWLIAADGMHSHVRRSLGLDAPPDAPRRYGLRRHFRVAPWADTVDVWWAADVEAYVTPVAHDTVGVALLFGDAARATLGEQDGATYDVLLRSRFPDLAARLVQPASSIRGAGPFQQRSTHRTHGRVLLVGDAAGYVDAITGEGTKVGIVGARAAVDAIVHDDPQRYERAWRGLWRPYWLATTGLLMLTRPPVLRRALPQVLARAPWVFDAALRVLAS